MNIEVYVTSSFLAFDTNRRYGDYDVVLLQPSKSDKPDDPLVIHFRSGTLMAEFDKVSPNVRPWGDGSSTVPNMRNHPGPAIKFIEELEQLGQVTTIGNS